MKEKYVQSFAGNISLEDSNGQLAETTLSQNFKVGQFQHKISRKFLRMKLCAPESYFCVLVTSLPKNVYQLSLLKNIVVERNY